MAIVIFLFLAGFGVFCLRSFQKESDKVDEKNKIEELQIK